jgi:hypothetical protein
MNKLTDVGSSPSAGPVKEQTVGECLDERIAGARKNVERLCNLKAKAEACNLLGYPQQFFSRLIW